MDRLLDTLELADVSRLRAGQWDEEDDTKYETRDECRNLLLFVLGCVKVKEHQCGLMRWRRDREMPGCAAKYMY